MSVVRGDRVFHTTLVLPTTSLPQLPAEMHAELCKADRPLALFPVRLETRFFAKPDGHSELRVRVYPDRIHIDAHETELTPAERTWGEHYWTQVWRAGKERAAQENAWRQLAERYDPQRAGWIARVTRPTNVASRPGSPLSAEGPPSPAPVFPAVAVVAGEDAAWRRAPQARLLPDRWIAIVQASGRPVVAVVGRDVRRDLAVGPDPKAPDATIAGDQSAVDAGMKWMVDFDAAEEAGMALRIPIGAPTLAAGIESLFVFGAAAGTTADDSAQQLGRLLDAQHYTDGLEFLRVGTPSNNTASARSGYSTDGAGPSQSFDAEGLVEELTLDEDTNAHRLGTAFGLRAHDIPAVLGRTLGGTDQHERDARSIHIALWQATWGYFLTNMIGMDGTGLTPGTLTWAREHFITHVRSAGPFPPLRCGKQPYGVLPVTSLDYWQPRAGEEAAYAPDLWLKAFLLRLRDSVWRPRLPQVARLGLRNPPNPDADLADVMRTDALSNAYRARSLFGRHYLEHLREFMGQNLESAGFNAVHDAVTAGILQRLGFPWRSRLSRATYADLAARVSAPLVQSGEVSRWRRLEPNYVAALLNDTSIGTLLGNPPGDGTSLLHALLRHSLLLEYAHATALIAATEPGASAAQLLRDPELIDLVSGGPLTSTWKRQLERSIPAITGTRTIREHLDGLASFETPEVAALGAFRNSLEHLQALDSEALQYLMQGTIDLASYRLDAWMTSFATKRLAEMRTRTGEGVYVGGYGWVENLRPEVTPRTEVPAPPGETAPIFAHVDDTGFIHAPSVTHAATAALLRNTHLGATGTAEASGPFAIDLSSRRVREASWLLDGVRQGQPLGALLGYRFERRLHDLEMDRFIDAFRELAPLTARKLENTDRPVESIAANNVVDGLALHQKWTGSRHDVERHLNNAGAFDNDMPSLVRELDALAECIDAISDVLTAETAYQMVRGNTARLASTLHALANGDAPAPELEVARTPRTGIALTHRLLQLFSGAPVATPGWTAASPRATAEPMLNAWAAQLLGDPRKVRCTIERLGADGAVLEARTMVLGDLPLTPLDVVYGVDVQVSATQLCEIEQRVLHEARRPPHGFAADARLGVRHARPADLGPEELTLLDVLEQARRLRRLLTGARAADAEDLTPPERGESGAVDLTELATRVVSAERAFRAAHQTLDALLKPGTPAASDVLRAALLQLGGFGVPGSVPVMPTGDDAMARAALTTQAIAVMKEANARITEGDALIAAPPPAEPRAHRNHLLERMKAVFGPAFVVMPLFECAHADELGHALKASTAAQDGDPLNIHTWFTRCARVREQVARWSAPLRGAEVLRTGERLGLRVAQLPFDRNRDQVERWVGLPALPGHELPSSKLSLVVQSAATLQVDQPMSGLLVDEWTEVVPSRTETTAVAFQFNPPDACAPQSVLLAVPPVLDQAWTVAGLHRVLVETLDMAKLRAVDAEALGEIGHYVPALFFAFNANDEVVSTDFTPLTR